MNPDFRSKEFLTDEIRRTLAFYDPRCIDPNGGFYHCYLDDGTIYDSATRHLVSSTRFVFDYAMAHLFFGSDDYRARTRHGIDFVRNVHRDPETGGYRWELSGSEVVDATNHCYGLAFVVLAYACGVKAGIEEARGWLAETRALMDEKFWQPAYGLYASEASSDWVLATYRGQNDNMHACEAMIAAFEATQETSHIVRAETLAESMTVRLAARTEGQVWEHYRPDWSADLEYNKGNRENIFRPWGYQTGHQTEWTKLLLLLDRYSPAAWHFERARELFDRAMRHGWDSENGGLIYGWDLEGRPYDSDKYHWVQAESLAAAALLAEKDPRYWEWYDRIWQYAWRHFVDHRHGGWFRRLTPNNQKYDDKKSPPGKADYHNMGACYDVLKVLDRLP
jgi:mannose/cellobiose epimerase-like protein (N-acyl-D-glucosamine 2-epimerase family)